MPEVPVGQGRRRRNLQEGETEAEKALPIHHEQQQQ